MADAREDYHELDRIRRGFGVSILEVAERHAAEALDEIDRLRALLAEEADPIHINPSRRSGAPCLSGTRLTCEHVATGIADEGSVDAYLDSYDLPLDRRRDCLIAAAWWVRTGHVNETGRACQLRTAWAQWANDLWSNAWHSDGRDLPDPPAVEQ